MSFVIPLPSAAQHVDFHENLVAKITFSNIERNVSKHTDAKRYSILWMNATIEIQSSAGSSPPEQQESNGLKDFLTATQIATPFSSGDSWSGRIALVLSKISGYYFRTGCFNERFIGCDDLGVLVDRSIFGNAVSLVEGEDVQQILDHSSLLVIRPNTHPQLSDEDQVLEELHGRIDFQWTVKEMPVVKTLAYVDGHLNPESQRGLWKSANALGVKIVQLDRSDHWITDPAHRYMYNDYIAIDMTADEGFHRRIAEAVENHRSPVDGISATATYCLPAVAKAAAMLGLPTEHPESISRANDKYETRIVHADNIQTQLFSELSALETDVVAQTFTPEYPVIIKPSFGTGSAHVYKVDNEAELLEAAGRISSGTKKKLLVEAYVEGPELDINFVLLDGKILFFEMNDDFPSPGDQSSLEGHFWETINVFPTILPVDEYALLQDNLHRLLLKMGLKTGVFHLEARVQHSKMNYTWEDGIYDLRMRSCSEERPKPRCFLIEINPRPPGMACCYATGATYGVNLYDLHVLRALGDFERFQALAQPFEAHESIPFQARIWSAIFWLQANKGGICATDERNSERLEKLSLEHRAMINRSVCFFKRGQRIPEPAPGIIRLGGFLFLTSRESREDVLRLIQILQKDLSIPVDIV